MADRVKIIKGFQDVLPPASNQWARIEAACRDLLRSYGFEEVRLPVMEPTELFARGIGEGTDIVEKEMYTFPDRKGRSLTLRPEGTAGVVRAYLASGLGKGEAARWFYSGPMFRYERPQKGRYRQFYQIGAEAIGYPGPGADAEIIELLGRLFGRLGVGERISLEINSLGCRECRPAYREGLIKYLDSVRDQLCEDCGNRMERNPLRVLDCKIEGCREAVKDAPAPFNHLCAGCRDHFEGLLSRLDLVGAKYRVNHHIVRGLDYYTRTVFEFLATDGLGSQNAVCAGGRYDNLVEDFGGTSTPAVGFAFGMERLALLMGEAVELVPEYFLVTAGEAAAREGLLLLSLIRDKSIFADMVEDAATRSMKSQMKAAAKSGSDHVVIIGEDELKNGRVTVKDLKTGGQETMTRDEFLHVLDQVRGEDEPECD